MNSAFDKLPAIPGQLYPWYLIRLRRTATVAPITSVDCLDD